MAKRVQTQDEIDYLAQLRSGQLGAPKNLGATTAGSDPRLLQKFQQGVAAGKYSWGNERGANTDYTRFLNDEYQANPQGFQMPKGFHVGQSGAVEQDRGNILERHGWILPLLAGGAMGAIAAPVALSALGAAGAPASAAPAIATGPGAAGIAGTTAVPATLGGASAAALPTAAAAGTFPAIATGPGAAGIAGTTAVPTTVGGTVASTGGILSKAKDIYGKVKTAGDVAQNIGGVLGQAAGARAQNQDRNTVLQYQREQMRQNAPEKLLRDVRESSRLAAGPEQFNWGGKGTPMSFTGGAQAGITPERRAAMQPFIDQQIQDLLKPRLDQPQFDPSQSGGFDKALGVTGLATGLLGAFGKQQIRNPQTVATSDYSDQSYTGGQNYPVQPSSASSSGLTDLTADVGNVTPGGGYDTSDLVRGFPQVSPNQRPGDPNAPEWYDPRRRPAV